MTEAPEDPRVAGREPVFRHIDDPDLPWQAVKSQRNADGSTASVWEKWFSFSPDPQYLSLYARYDPGMIVRRHGHFSPHVVFVISGELWCGERRCPAGTHIELPFGAAFGPMRAGGEGALLFEVMMGDPRSWGDQPEVFERTLADHGATRLPDPPLEYPAWLSDLRTRWVGADSADEGAAPAAGAPAAPTPSTAGQPTAPTPSTAPSTAGQPTAPAPSTAPSGISSHDAIRNLLGRYCALIDAGDFAGLGELFARASLTDHTGGAYATGREEVARSWDGQVRRYEDGTPHTCHLTINSVIDVDEAAGTATASSTYLVLQATDVLPLQPVITGRYLDRFARDPAGAWYFSERRFFVSRMGDLSQHLTFDVSAPAD